MFRVQYPGVPSKSNLGQILRLLAIPAIALTASYIAWRMGYFELEKRRALADFVQGTRHLPVIQLLYMAGYLVIIVLCLPAVVATILGGAFFGWFWGGVLAWVSQVIGTALTYLLARRVARAPLQRMFGHHRLLDQLKNDVGLAGLFRLRVLPVAPFGAFAYVAGIAGVSLRKLLIATGVAMLPSLVAYTYVGSQLMRGLTDPTVGQRALQIAGYVTLAMLGISIVPLLVRRLSA